MLNNGLFQSSWWVHREGQSTVKVLEFDKCCIDHEAVAVKEIGGWKAGW